MPSLDLLRCATVAEEAARTAGNILLDWQERFQPQEKGPNDFVTEADFASQKAIEAILLGTFPDHAFMGEEDTGTTQADRTALTQPGAIWVVDPLDGTANYVHHLQTYAVSIALIVDGVISVGMIYDPVSRECYKAIRGQGVWLNDKPLRVSPCQTLRQAVVAVSFSNVLSADSPEITRFVDILLQASSVRRLGSAALNLAYLAAGRLDAYYANSVKAWDIAAGVLMVEEAGGVVSHMRGGPFDILDPVFLASATPELHAELLPKMSI